MVVLHRVPVGAVLHGQVAGIHGGEVVAHDAATDPGELDAVVPARDTVPGDGDPGCPVCEFRHLAGCHESVVDRPGILREAGVDTDRNHPFGALEFGPYRDLVVLDADVVNIAFASQHRDAAIPGIGDGQTTDGHIADVLLTSCEGQHPAGVGVGTRHVDRDIGQGCSAGTGCDSENVLRIIAGPVLDRSCDGGTRAVEVLHSFRKLKLRGDGVALRRAQPDPDATLFGELQGGLEGGRRIGGNVLRQQGNESFFLAVLDLFERGGVRRAIDGDLTVPGALRVGE